MWRRRFIPAAIAIMLAAGLWWFDIRNSEPPAPVQSHVPTDLRSAESNTDSNGSPEVTIADVLDRARAAITAMSTSLDDYTATFVKQERSDKGVLSEESRIAIRAQTRLRNDADDAPPRVYLRFEAPAGNAGREVIWGADLYDGQMAVHETAFLLNLKTLWLDPTGMIAMQGQKYPVSEIGLVRMAEKLIERGEAMRGEIGIKVQVDPGYEFDGHPTTMYRIARTEPSGSDDDFAVAEVVIDFDRNLVLHYRSFGWPTGDQPQPMLESYSYRDVQTNVGLTDADFDYKNPKYGFPN